MVLTGSDEILPHVIQILNAFWVRKVVVKCSGGIRISMKANVAKFSTLAVPKKNSWDF